MRLTEPVLVLFVLAWGCSSVPFLAPEPGEPRSPSTLRLDEESEGKLRARFPGAKTLRLVKLLRWTERTPGPCTADFGVGEDETRIDLRYRTKKEEHEIDGGGLEDLQELGWLPAYRAPIGVGFEKEADFREIDLTARQTLVCQCFDADRASVSHPTELRFRWSEGALPEISAAVERDGRPVGLKPAIVAGKLVRYEFPVTESLPPGRVGRCEGRLALTILIDPPLL